VYNYSPWLEKIPSVTDFAFDRLTPFIKSSRDEVGLPSFIVALEKDPVN
jgi:hypothetical protein